MNKFLLNGVALLVMTNVSYAAKPNLTLCSGPDGGNYQRAAVEVMNQAKDKHGMALELQIKVI